MKTMILAAIVTSGLSFSANAVELYIEPAAGDCANPVNAPIDGQLPSTVTWCPESQENPVLQPKL